MARALPTFDDFLDGNESSDDEDGKVGERDRLYTLLGVERESTLEEIKKAYRQKAKETHPDRHPPQNREEFQQKFQEIQTAYEILKDPALRNQYDSSGIESTSITLNWDMIFTELFGADDDSEPHSESIRIPVSVTLEEVYAGREILKTINRETDTTCNKCNGNGGFGRKIKCQHCGGIGRIQMQTASGGSYSVPCDYCNGSKTNFADYNACCDCGGSGRVCVVEQLDVRIPIGAKNGDVVLKRSLVEVVVHCGNEHGIFTRDGDDVIVEGNCSGREEEALRVRTRRRISIFGSEAIVKPGTEIEVTRAGDLFVLIDGYGFPSGVRNHRGNMRLRLFREQTEEIQFQLDESCCEGACNIL